MLSVLKRRQFARSISDEAGATTAIFAIVVLVGVMAGTFALVVDAGQLFLERRVVQNVADASAGYLTQSCATGGICEPTIPSSYTENNSPDSNTEIIEICGTPDGFDPCTDLVGDIRDCLTPSSALANSNFVRVRSQTLTISDTSALSPTFARLFGASSDDGNWTLRGCSQGIWGAPSSTTVSMPLAVSICDFVPPTSSTTPTLTPIDAWNLGNGGCSIQDLNGVSIAGTDKGVAPIVLRVGGNDLDTIAECNTGATVNIGDQIEYPTGASSQRNLCGGISVILNNLVTAAEPGYIPIFGSSVSVTNGNRYVTVIAFARFRLTGYKMRPPLGCGGSGPACQVNWDAAYPCAEGNDLCVVGEFLKGIPPSGNISGGSYVPSLGPLAFNLIP